MLARRDLSSPAAHQPLGKCIAYRALVAVVIVFFLVGASLLIEIALLSGAFQFQRAVSAGVILIAGTGSAAYVLRLRRKPVDEQVAFFCTNRVKRLVAALCLLLLFLAVAVPVTLGMPIILVLTDERLYMPLVLVGMALLMLGLWFRTGTVARCASCDYEQGVPPPGGPGVPRRCSECGSFWTRRGGTVIGTLHRDPRFIMAGILVLAIAAASIATTFLGLSSNLSASTQKRLPTNALIALALGAGLQSGLAWDELPNRTLTPQQAGQLVRGVVDQTPRRKHVPYAADQSLNAIAGSGTLTPELMSELVMRRTTGSADGFWPHLWAYTLEPGDIEKIVRWVIDTTPPGSRVPLGSDRWLTDVLDSRAVSDELATKLRLRSPFKSTSNP